MGPWQQVLVSPPVPVSVLQTPVVLGLLAQRVLLAPEREQAVCLQVLQARSAL